MTIGDTHHHWHFHHHPPAVEVPPWAELNRKLDLILKNQETIMATLDETLAATTAEDTKIDSIIAYNTGIKKQLDDVLAGASLPPAVQAKVDAIFAQANASASKIDTALAANTPAAPAAGA